MDNKNFLNKSRVITLTILLIIAAILYLFSLSANWLPEYARINFLPNKTAELPSSQAVSKQNICGLDEKNCVGEKDISAATATLLVNDKKYETEIIPERTVYYLMTELAKTTDLKFAIKEYKDMGIFVEEINGIKNDPEKKMYWIYYVNDKLAEVGIGQYIVKQNDKITWKYEKSKY